MVRLGSVNFSLQSSAARKFDGRRRRRTCAHCLNCDIDARDDENRHRATYYRDLLSSSRPGRPTVPAEAAAVLVLVYDGRSRVGHRQDGLRRRPLLAAVSPGRRRQRRRCWTPTARRRQAGQAGRRLVRRAAVCGRQGASWLR